VEVACPLNSANVQPTSVARRPISAGQRRHPRSNEDYVWLLDSAW
jgi:hypothetical protein